MHHLQAIAERRNHADFALFCETLREIVSACAHAQSSITADVD
jgi:hypothetical protein